MIDGAVRAEALHRVHHVPTIDGFSIAVGVSGPEKGTTVVMLGNRRRFGAYNALCRRLHIAMLRTVVLGATMQLNAKAVIGVLDRLGVSWPLLVGGKAGGDLAWALAANHQEHFSGLVAINSGHPRAPDFSGVIRDNRCPPVEINTTLLVDTSRREVARATGRYVYGDFRVAQLVVGHHRHTTAQLATEIVLRAHAW
jgi:pimeloyl-ACP methyl ester carboxylesterase